MWRHAIRRAVSTAHPDHVIGHGAPAGCTSAAVVRAVAEGGIITFDCGPNPVTITMTATAKIVHGRRIVVDGGGKVTLSGGGKIRILEMNTCSSCWEQAGPRLIVQNMRFTDGYSGGSGGAVYTDGDSYNLIIDGTAMHDNSAREGGGGIFCVVNNDQGVLKIEYSVLHHNPSGQFENAPGIFDSRNGHDVQPIVIHSTIN